MEEFKARPIWQRRKCLDIGQGGLYAAPKNPPFCLHSWAFTNTAMARLTVPKLSIRAVPAAGTLGASRKINKLRALNSATGFEVRRDPLTERSEDVNYIWAAHVASQNLLGPGTVFVCISQETREIPTSISSQVCIEFA